ncbi:MAG: cell wall-binding repeat-containing protein [Euzebya sp.]
MVRRLGATAGALVLMLLLLTPPPALAAGFIVTANRVGAGLVSDPAPDGCSLDDCSLREAVIAANSAPGADVITFQSPGTIRLTESRAEVPDSHDPTTQDLDVSDELVIMGSGVRIESGLAMVTEDSRAITATAPLTLDGISVQGFEVALDGAAVHSSSERTQIHDSTFAGNIAKNGGAVAIADGDVVISDSVFHDNGGLLTDFGGAISVSPGASGLRVVESTFLRNTSALGAMALDARPTGYVDIIRSSFVSQVVVNEGMASRGLPAATVEIQDPATGASIINSTFSGNRGKFVADLASSATPVRLLFTTHVNGTTVEPGVVVEAGSGQISVSGSAFSGPTQTCGNGVTSAGHSVFVDAGCPTPGVGDVVNTNLGLLELDPTTGVHYPSPGSPVVDVFPAPDCAEGMLFDQIGHTRMFGAGCDAGAAEFVGEVGPVLPISRRCEGGMAASPESRVVRLQGATRIQTATAISQRICSDGQAPAVVLARADDFADAQAGTPLAVRYGAPTLLSYPQSLHPATRTEIQRILPAGGTVFLLGGTAALSGEVQAEIEAMGYQTVRFAGDNRFSTATTIADLGLANPSRLVVADGGRFIDAILAGSLASGFLAADPPGAAVILTSGPEIQEDAFAYIDAVFRGTDIFAIGADVGELVGDPVLVGADATDLSLRVADLTVSPTTVGVATTADFPDALAGSALIGRVDTGPGVMLLTGGVDLERSISNYLSDNVSSIRQVVIFGGTAVIGEEVLRDIEQALST